MSQTITPASTVSGVGAAIDEKDPLLLRILGFPIPFTLGLYAVALLCSMSGMEVFAWLTTLFTILYIVGDKMLGTRRFQPFFLGVEVPLLILLIVAASGLLVNAPSVDFITHFGSLRWAILLYSLAYAMAISRSLNRVLYVLIGAGAIVAGYAVFQHFTGVDLVRGTDRPVPLAPFDGADVYQVRGLLNHHLTYGYSFAMLACLPLAGMLLGSRRSPILRVGFIAASAVFAASLVWTYGRGVWFAIVIGFLVMASQISKRHLVALLVLLGIGGTVMYTSSPGLQKRFATIFDADYFSNEDRRNLWNANWGMFVDYPWLGVGYKVNENRTSEYYQKLGIQSEFGGHAHNNYIQMLSTTGFLGFAAYMFFILGFMMMSHRLFNDIPRTHFWHRMTALGVLGAQVALHTGGVTQWNFGDAEVNHVFILMLAMTAYLSDRYSRGIVPDDFAL